MNRLTCILLLVLVISPSVIISFDLKLDDDYKPPLSIPTDPDLQIYSAAAKDQARRPIVIHLVHPNGTRVMDNITVTVTTVLAGNGTDNYTGLLCEGNRMYADFTYRYWNGSSRDQWWCVNSTMYPMGFRTNSSSNGEVYFQRMLHSVATMSNRKYKFTAEYQGVNLTLLSNQYRVFHPAAKASIHSLTITGSIPVNHPFNATIRTLYEWPLGSGNYSLLTEGPHSRLNVDAYVHYKFKRVTSGRDIGGNIHKVLGTDVTLGGNGVFENAKFDLMIRTRAMNGEAFFEGIRILDIMDFVQLNFTQTLPHYPWERRPFGYNEIWTVNSDRTKDIQYPTISSPAVAISDNFTVTPIPATELRLDVTGMDTSVDANFKFVNPPTITLHDSLGYRVTSGPDSTQTIMVTLNPSSACLSVDSTELIPERGMVRFYGSMCRPHNDLKMQFSTITSNGSNLNTSWTPLFNATGTLRYSLAMLTYRNGLQWSYSIATRTMINQGYWSPEFVEQGRKLEYDVVYREDYEVDNSSWAFQYYRDIDRKNKDPNGKHIHAILGGQYNKDTLALSSFATIDKVPVVGVYLSDSDELSNKLYHPYFYRANRSYKVQYDGILKFMKAHYWDRIVVLTDTGTPVESGFYDALLDHKIEFYEVKIEGASSISGALALPDDKINEAVVKIKSYNIRVIMLMMATPTVHRLFIEGMQQGFSCYHGYQWVSTGDAIDYFGYVNHLPGCKDGPVTCTIAYTGTFFISNLHFSYSYSRSQDWYAPVYRDGFYDLYTQVDPYKVYGYLITYAPSVNGRYGIFVDAMVTHLKVACWFFNRNMTFDPDKMISIVRNISFDGMSGAIEYNEVGDRIGFEGQLYMIDPFPDGKVLTLYDVIKVGYIDYDSNGNLIDRQQYYSYSKNRTTGEGYFYTIGSRKYAKSNYTNVVRTNGTIFWSTYDEVPGNHVMNVPATYFCEGGCGGLRTNPDLIWYFENGDCVSMNTCKCKLKAGKNEVGYAGEHCEQTLCKPQCKHGECIAPDTCTCDTGYTGLDCGTPVCSTPCSVSNGFCAAPDYCQCNDSFWGVECAGLCSCGEHGVCNGGSTGNGMCTCDSLYIGESCQMNLIIVVVPTLLSAILIVGSIITLVTLLLMYVVKRERYRAALANNDWKIEYSQVRFSDADDGKSFRSLMSMQSQIKRNRHVIRNEGKYRDQPVVIKRLKKESVIDTLALRKEIKEMRDLKHTNVTNFVGACLESPNVCLLIELAGKGSMDDLLSSSEVKIDWNFKYSMIKDICRGLIYLSKSPIKTHGRLKSSNCVVDNRWCVKITDFGLNILKSGQQGVPKKPFRSIKEAIDEEAMHSRGQQGSGDKAHISGTSQNCQVQYTTIKFEDRSIAQSLLSIPPEFLKFGVTHPDHIESGTPAGDIYCIGLIMSELVNHEGPFSDFLDYMLPTEILDTICGCKNHAVQTLPPNLADRYKGANPPPFRPNLKEECDYDFKSLMAKCWSDDPRKRPNLPDVLNALEELSPQKGELIDNLVYMLEKYSTNLEKVVAARTAQLAVEKQKTEDLLSRMLPKSVSEALKEGRTVEAETFDCVTIYFSDIVGFTSIAGGSTPMQVVSFLNDLYSAFDHALYNYDVYKVETIGDAYMVVSGLPIRNGDNHAGEICQMAIHLLSDISRFTIRHKPDVVLQLRIGVHSGPVVAGVVGLKMPRYCLFGDTVNVSSRMESSGLALRVHVSEDTAIILKKLGGYQLECRGTRDVKGKGRMTTYWLRGKEGFHKKIPDASLAVSESQHEFK